jgi:hypothetical protein
VPFEALHNWDVICKVFAFDAHDFRDLNCVQSFLFQSKDCITRAIWNVGAKEGAGNDRLPASSSLEKVLADAPVPGPTDSLITHLKAQILEASPDLLPVENTRVKGGTRYQGCEWDVRSEDIIMVRTGLYS